MSQVVETMEKLGIDDKQAKVYLACLELGSATISELSEKSGIKRTSIYNFIEEMKQKGMITEIKEKKHSLFLAEDPNLLLSRAQDQVKNISDLLPELMGIFNRPGNKPKVKYYKGIPSLKRAYDDLLETNETKAYGFSDYAKMFKVFDHDFLWSFPPRRAAKKIFFYCVAKDDKTGREIQGKDGEHMRTTKLIKKIEFDTEINIYGNKVMMLSFRRPYAGVIIEDVAIATTMKSIWKLVWQGTKS